MFISANMTDPNKALQNITAFVLAIGIKSALSVLWTGAQDHPQPPPPPVLNDHVTEIQIAQGRIRGTMANPNVIAYMGLRYARAPVGELRFKPPFPIDPWSNVQDAVTPGPKCPQLPALSDSVPGSQLTMDEDCLRLNIYVMSRPLQPSDRLLPVLVYFHGGGIYESGSNTDLPAEELLSTYNLPRQNGIIVVSVNYRLGILGFLSGTDDYLQGNYGLLDQQAALEWVRENIRYFGGDAQIVTLLGHGAGAASISLHMLSIKSQGLFHRAILMSGVATAPWAIRTTTREQNYLVADLLNCPREPSFDLLMCLQSKPIQDILNAQLIMTSDERYANHSTFTPVVDHYLMDDRAFMPRSPDDILRYPRHGLQPIPLIIGTVKDDGTMFLYRDPRISQMSAMDIKYHFIQRAVPPVVDETVKTETAQVLSYLIRNQYVESVAETNKTAMLTQLVKFHTDSSFKAPAEKFASLWADRGGPVYYYIFEQPGADTQGNAIQYGGARHTTDLLYLFGPTLFTFVNRRPPRHADEQLILLMKVFFTTFAITGTTAPPNTQYRWLPIRGSNPHYVQFDYNRPLRPFEPNQPDTAFWNILLPRVSLYLQSNTDPTSDRLRQHDPTEPYQTAMWTLVGVAAAAIFVAILICILCTRKRKQEKEKVVLRSREARTSHQSAHL